MTDLWIDTDMGSDDAFAIILAMQHRQVAGISLVSGNAPLDQVARNAAGFAGLLGWDSPIFAGADRPIVGPLETAQRILGETGLPLRGEEPLFLQFPKPVFSYFLTPLCNWLERAETPCDILALGPLTNLAILALARPDLLDRISQVVWMGGAVGRGNHTAAAEFNAFADPEAAQILLDRGLALRMIDLDACRKVLIDESDVDRLHADGGPQGKAMERLLGGYLDIALSRGRPAMALYDPVAAAALIAPDLFTFTPAHMVVECQGRVSRGRTVVDFLSATPNTSLATEVDAPAVRQLCLEALSRI